MKTIWKYDLNITDRQTVRVPKDAQALTAQIQREAICLWAMVDTDNADVGVDMPVFIHGTGHHVDPEARDGRYLSTVQMRGGSLIFHVFIGIGF